MNTTASYISEPSWSRRSSTETVFSIQGRETDIVQDSSDSEWASDDDDLQYEPATASEKEAPISEATSGQSDYELIAKKVIQVSADDDGDLQLADSEQSGASDSEQALPQYGSCARCHGANDNKRYRYCERCFKLRKNFFPPRPRAGRKAKTVSSSQSSTSSQEYQSSVSPQDIQPSTSQQYLSSVMSQDSGLGSQNSQELASSEDILSSGSSQDFNQDSQETDNGKSGETMRLGKLKRRSESADRLCKRPRLDSESENESREVEVAPLVKSISDPAVTIESLEGSSNDNLCIICLSEPKSGVFVHRRVAHICCCYKCAVKVWSKAKRCPICNCKVSNVLKAVVT